MEINPINVTEINTFHVVTEILPEYYGEMRFRANNPYGKLRTFQVRSNGN